jgi:hypothetical protein
MLFITKCKEIFTKCTKYLANLIKFDNQSAAAFQANLHYFAEEK